MTSKLETSYNYTNYFSQGILLLAYLISGFFVFKSYQQRLKVFWTICISSVLLDISLYSKTVVPLAFYIFLNTAWISLYISAHWLFCWNYYVCSADVKRRMQNNYDDLQHQQNTLMYKRIELYGVILITLGFTLVALFVDDPSDSLYYAILILTFQSINLTFLTLALIRI